MTFANVPHFITDRTSCFWVAIRLAYGLCQKVMSVNSHKYTQFKQQLFALSVRITRRAAYFSHASCHAKIHVKLTFLMKPFKKGVHDSNIATQLYESSASVPNLLLKFSQVRRALYLRQKERLNDRKLLIPSFEIIAILFLVTLATNDVINITASIGYSCFCMMTFMRMIAIKRWSVRQSIPSSQLFYTQPTSIWNLKIVSGYGQYFVETVQRLDLIHYLGPGIYA